MCTISGLYSNSSYQTKPTEWVWLKEAALNFAIALIVGSLSAYICYALKGGDLDLFYKIGGGTALGIFAFINIITLIKKEGTTHKTTFDVDLEDIIKNEEPSQWLGKKPGEIVPNLFVVNPTNSKTCDYEIRLRVLRSNEPFPQKTALQNKWQEGSIIYYDVAINAPKGLFKLQARRLADFVEEVRENGKTVLFSGVYNSSSEKISMDPLQKESPFVDVGIMVAHYLMQKTECSREEVLSFIARELEASYSDHTRIYNGQKGLTLSKSVHIDAFCPESAAVFLDAVDTTTIASKRYQPNQKGFEEMISDIRELLDMEDDEDTREILTGALKELEGPFNISKIVNAKATLQSLPD